MITILENLTPVHSQPNDRVVYADRWQGTLDSPSAEDLEWLAANSILPPVEDPISFEPSDADWDDYARWAGAISDDDIAAAGLAVG